MNHEEFRELAALDLYGEIDDAARARLAAHRTECGECRALAARLERGLGRMARSSAAEDLPEGWTDRIRDETWRSVPARRASATRRAFAAGVAAGIAAGFAAAYVALAPIGAPSAAEGARAPAFGRETPPPKAAAFGELAHLGRSLPR